LGNSLPDLQSGSRVAEHTGGGRWVFELIRRRKLSDAAT
jgi:hypothetical protein